MTDAAQNLSRRNLLRGVGAFGAMSVIAACTSNEASDDAATTAAATTAAATGDTETEAAAQEEGPAVTIGFSAPEADHGWIAAVTDNAAAAAEQFGDVTFEATEGTNDVNQQISQVETLINGGVDVLAILPFDGAALTEIAQQAMDAGIPVVNIDRIFDSPLAYRTYIGGDNYGMGVSAGNFIGQRLTDEGVDSPVIAEIAGIDQLPLTQARSQGFADALEGYGFSVTARQAAEFTVESGQQVTANLLQAEPEIDAIWNHDDDQGVGVLAAINEAGRNEFFMVGGAGSANAMREIQSGESVLVATVLYSPTMAGSGINLARLIAQNKGMSDLVELAVPASITTFSATVTADNVEEYLPYGFES
ncbi:substrate-binding domain-containing protein [Salsipaludibacter albus]|uniref:substrate-binding domain-containing protein n=1 Tax=Salsipaludibacter albus TaxID=2849650 RepID=UPI001EE45CF5|nr:substrate-binding domain-containing protein [Salsipaludibacter albus]MBY5163857.1 substrate-binding domain-containing protein [Salsipaludibacter albus]